MSNAPEKKQNKKSSKVERILKIAEFVIRKSEEGDKEYTKILKEALS
jgi:hypothetical protein